jgi:hypothetical protein
LFAFDKRKVYHPDIEFSGYILKREQWKRCKIPQPEIPVIKKALVTEFN